MVDDFKREKYIMINYPFVQNGHVLTYELNKECLVLVVHAGVVDAADNECNESRGRPLRVPLEW